MEKKELQNRVVELLNPDAFRTWLEAKHQNQQVVCQSKRYRSVTHPLAVYLASNLPGHRVEVADTCVLLWPDRKEKPVKVFFQGSTRWAERFVRDLWPHYHRKVPTAFRCLQVLRGGD